MCDTLRSFILMQNFLHDSRKCGLIVCKRKPASVLRIVNVYGGGGAFDQAAEYEIVSILLRWIFGSSGIHEGHAKDSSIHFRARHWMIAPSINLNPEQMEAACRTA